MNILWCISIYAETCKVRHLHQQSLKNWSFASEISFLDWLVSQTLWGKSIFVKCACKLQFSYLLVQAIYQWVPLQLTLIKEEGNRSPLEEQKITHFSSSMNSKEKEIINFRLKFIWTYLSKLKYYCYFSYFSTLLHSLLSNEIPIFKMLYQVIFLFFDRTYLNQKFSK